MNAVEIAVLRFVEDADQIDRGLGAAHQTRQRRWLVNVAFDDVHRRQKNQVPRALAAARRDDGAVAGRDQPRDQVSADKPSAAEHDNGSAAHGVTGRSAAAIGKLAGALRGVTVPRRAVKGT